MKELFEEVKDGLQELSDDAFDPIAKQMVAKWSYDTGPLNILETLDACVHGSLCDGVSIEIMDMLMRRLLEQQGQTYEQLVEQAVWRKKYEY